MRNAVRERAAGARGAAAATGPAATARGGMGVTEHGQPISATFLRRLACHADITPVVLDHAGAILWTGRRFRFATARQLAALHVRDAGCSFPGCDRPPSWCQAHHIRHWIDGGPTDLDNLALLCERHHHVVHSRGYTATATTTGVTWHTPSHRHARTPEAAPTDLLTRLHQRADRGHGPPDGESPIAG